MKTGIIVVNDNLLEVLIAQSEVEQQRGLMYIPAPTPNMVFPYDFPNVNKFWMKATPSELDIIFCYKGKISQIHRGEPFSTQAIGNNEFSDLIIELPYGTAKELNLQIGNKISLLK